MTADRARGSFDLRGQVAVVTGGNAGIGFGMARALAQAGSSIAVWGRRIERNDQAARALAEFGVPTIGVECDVAEEASVERAMTTTLEALGRIDTCLTSAGVASERYPFSDFPTAEWRRVLSVDLDGTFSVMRCAARTLIEQGEGGSLIAVSSVSALHACPHAAPYGVAKAALTSLVKTMGAELARHNIRANAVLPGWIDTELIADVTGSPAIGDAVLRRIPARRWGTPDDLGGIAVYLAAPVSSYHTADVIRIDGGYAIY